MKMIAIKSRIVTNIDKFPLPVGLNIREYNRRMESLAKKKDDIREHHINIDVLNSLLVRGI